MESFRGTMDGKKAAEGPRVTITIITTYLANNLWTGSIGGMIMLPAKLKTFHDDLIDGVHTLERGGFCFFIFKTVWKVWSGHFLLSIHNHIHCYVKLRLRSKPFAVFNKMCDQFCLSFFQPSARIRG